jgi:hypothetical protein
VWWLTAIVTWTRSLGTDRAWDPHLKRWQAFFFFTNYWVPWFARSSSPISSCVTHVLISFYWKHLILGSIYKWMIWICYYIWSLVFLFVSFIDLGLVKDSSVSDRLLLVWAQPLPLSLIPKQRVSYIRAVAQNPWIRWCLPSVFQTQLLTACWAAPLPTKPTVTFCSLAQIQLTTGFNSLYVQMTHKSRHP